MKGRWEERVVGPMAFGQPEHLITAVYDVPKFLLKLEKQGLRYYAMRASGYPDEWFVEHDNPEFGK